MSVTHGARVDVVREVAAALLVDADRLDGIQQDARRVVATMGESWVGADRDGQARQFAVADRQVTGLVAQLRGLAGELREQAGSQDSASAASAGGSGVPIAPISTPFDPTPGPLDPGELVRELFGLSDPFRPLDDATHKDGPRIPNVIGAQGLFQGDQPWTPQGLFWDKDNDWLLTTSYAEGDGAEDGSGLLTIQDKDGTVDKQVPISGNRHYGGVASDGDHVYVSGNGPDGGEPTITVYSASQLADWQEGDPAPAPLHTIPVDAASAITYADGSLYAAHYDKDGPGTLYAYSVNPDGTLDTSAQGSWTIPDSVNGVAIDGDRAYVSQNYGRSEASTMTSIDLSGPGSSRGEGSVKMPNMMEGITLVNGSIWSTYESGAGDYNDPVNQLKGIDPRDHLTVTHLSR